MMGALQLTLLGAATYMASAVTAADIAALLFAVSVLVSGT